MTPRTHYQVLDIKEDATKAEIRAAYKKKALQYHPDKSKEPNAKEVFQAINEANQVLSDDNKRRDYDRELKMERAREQAPKVTPKADSPKPAPAAPQPKTTHTQSAPAQKPRTYATSTADTYAHTRRPAQPTFSRPTTTTRPSHSASAPKRPAVARAPQRIAVRPMDAELFTLMILLNLQVMRQIQLQLAMQIIIRDMLAQQLNSIYQAQYASLNNKNHVETGFAYTTPGIRA